MILDFWSNSDHNPKIISRGTVSRGGAETQPLKGLASSSVTWTVLPVGVS
jgi:hypothetical protein